MDNNGYIKLNGDKGLWTLEEVIELLHFNSIKVKVIIGAKPGDRELDEQIQVNPVVKEV